jgi:uncharacterized membrane protein HdeD (DUF308 family)
MLFLPLLFVAVAAISRFRLATVEAALLVAVGLVFLFNNLAPPYEGRWQMRGAFIPRLYQPVFIALLVYVARAVATAPALPRPRPRLLLGATIVALVANATIVFGPVARVPWAGTVYGVFYLHSAPGTMDETLRHYGRRPLGFCRGVEARRD